jgi:hypothetical protein
VTIKLSELEAAASTPGARADAVTLGNSVASARAAGLERFTVGTEILGSVVRQADISWQSGPALIAIAKAALALRQAGLDGDEVIRMMGYATSSDEYSAACTMAPRVEERRQAALAELDAALREVSP